MSNKPTAAYNPRWLQKELDHRSYLLLFIPLNINLQQEQRNKHATLLIGNPQYATCMNMPVYNQ